ncbi:Pseudouridine kinase [Rhodobacteraceae bacterium THAF1]|uniref:PfkB family carbohydrate kinase n=1 Tax=Palleronia sp. THAF1 TaxID=2587842 RepID=UPI000F3F0259|nr:PfkB family carbohydrate kinase [Palleronia sp. THAF1]QFU08446.1 Pseudouridine kinase [Palleronia sp. THAF1]VDC29315.1 Pseudouridine kinase [Rhodobacteraceae bacterium THAF1]
MTRILCIGSVLWDVVGRTPAHMALGADVPGHIVRIPGGVALNIAMGLRRMGVDCALLSAVGRDVEGETLLADAARRGINVAHVYVSDDLPTDTYMAIEGGNGLIAAIADAHSLERAGAKILEPLVDGRVASGDFTGIAALDGNLSETLLSEIASGPWLGRADLRVAPASPGKALRLAPLLGVPGATFYLNREEAGLLLGTPVRTAAEGAEELGRRGAARVLVTDGGADAAMASGGRVLTATPPEVMVTRVTGAGDTFMAAHIAAETRGATAEMALEAGLRAAAQYVSGDVSQ